MIDKDHWERLYRLKRLEKLGWYEPHLGLSLKWIKSLHLPADAAILDVGGGASTLVDDLLHEGFEALTVLDISGQALARAKERLGPQTDRVTWLEGNITEVDLPPEYFALWHDRAAFHFLTDLADQQRYVDQIRKSLWAGGHVIIGTFSEEAPAMCSGLPVQRYNSTTLQAALGHQFALQEQTKELHLTPGGVEQLYLYCHLIRTS